MYSCAIRSSGPAVAYPVAFQLLFSKRARMKVMNVYILYHHIVCISTPSSISPYFFLVLSFSLSELFFITFFPALSVEGICCPCFSDSLGFCSIVPCQRLPTSLAILSQNLAGGEASSWAHSWAFPLITDFLDSLGTILVPQFYAWDFFNWDICFWFKETYPVWHLHRHISNSWKQNHLSSPCFYICICPPLKKKKKNPLLLLYSLFFFF